MDYKRDNLNFTKTSFMNTDALYIQSSKIDETIEYIKKNKVQHIILNSNKGYRGKSISFLKEVADQIIGIDIEIEVKDFSPLNTLVNLQYLSLTNIKPQQIVDFSNFKSLIECNIVWSEHIVNLSFCKRLKNLTVWNFDKSNLLEFKDIHSLELLSLYDCPMLSNLEGVEFLNRLQDVLFYNCRKLNSIKNIELIFETLTNLSLIKTKKIMITHQSTN